MRIKGLGTSPLFSPVPPLPERECPQKPEFLNPEWLEPQGFVLGTSGLCPDSRMPFPRLPTARGTGIQERPWNSSSSSSSSASPVSTILALHLSIQSALQPVFISLNSCSVPGTERDLKLRPCPQGPGKKWTCSNSRTSRKSQPQGVSTVRWAGQGSRSRAGFEKKQHLNWARGLLGSGPSRWGKERGKELWWQEGPTCGARSGPGCSRPAVHRCYVRGPWPHPPVLPVLSPHFQRGKRIW